MKAVPVILWIVVLLAFAGPSLWRTLSALWRTAGPGPSVFVLAALAAAFYAYPSSADKGGGTTNPPAVTVPVPAYTIRLIFEDGTMRLFPLGAPIREVRP